MSGLLAVINVAQLRHSLSDSRMAKFVDGLDGVNRLAESHSGFVWRSKGVAGHSALLHRAEGELFVNVSLWRTYPDFHDFTYSGAHGRYLTARARWFVAIPGPTTALWWTSRDDDRVTVEHGLVRLRLLRRDGPSPRAFSVLRQWDVDGHPVRPSRRTPTRRT